MRRTKQLPEVVLQHLKLVQRYNVNTGAIDTFIPVDRAPRIPGGSAFGPDGDFYIGDFSPVGSINRYNGNTGVFINTFVPQGSVGLSQGSRLLFKDNDLYVTSYGSNSVLRFNGNTGDFIDAFVTAGSGGLTNPIGIAFFPTPVPEPSSSLSILGLGVFVSSGLVLKHKQKKREVRQS